MPCERPDLVWSTSKELSRLFLAQMREATPRPGALSATGQRQQSVWRPVPVSEPLSVAPALPQLGALPPVSCVEWYPPATLHCI